MKPNRALIVMLECGHELAIGTDKKHLHDSRRWWMVSELRKKPQHCMKCMAERKVVSTRGGERTERIERTV